MSKGSGRMGCGGDKRLHGCRHKMWLYLESNLDYVLAWARLTFGSGYVDCTNIVRAGLALPTLLTALCKIFVI
jgi:hypothetical protein